MLSLDERTWPTMPTRLSFMRASAASRRAGSSLPRASMREVRSPRATVSASFTAWSMGPTMERVMATASSTPSTTAMATAVPSRISALR